MALDGSFSWKLILKVLFDELDIVAYIKFCLVDMPVSRSIFTLFSLLDDRQDVGQNANFDPKNAIFRKNDLSQRFYQSKIRRYVSIQNRNFIIFVEK